MPSSSLAVCLSVSPCCYGSAIQCSHPQNQAQSLIHTNREHLLFVFTVCYYDFLRENFTAALYYRPRHQTP